jgi:hypothetical protein
MDSHGVYGFANDVAEVNRAIHTLMLSSSKLPPEQRAAALRILRRHMTADGKVLLSWTPGEWRDEFPTVFDVPE